MGGGFPTRYFGVVLQVSIVNIVLFFDVLRLYSSFWSWANRETQVNYTLRLRYLDGALPLSLTKLTWQAQEHEKQLAQPLAALRALVVHLIEIH